MNGTRHHSFQHNSACAWVWLTPRLGGVMNMIDQSKKLYKDQPLADSWPNNEASRLWNRATVINSSNETLSFDKSIKMTRFTDIVNMIDHLQWQMIGHQSNNRVNEWSMNDSYSTLNDTLLKSSAAATCGVDLVRNGGADGLTKS